MVISIVLDLNIHTDNVYEFDLLIQLTQCTRFFSQFGDGGKNYLLELINV